MACLWGGVDSWPSAAHCKSYRFFGIACRLGRMVGTSRRPRVDGSVIAHRILTVIIFQGWDRRPPSLNLDRIYSLRMIDWAARLRFLNTTERSACLDELGRTVWHGTSSMTRPTTAVRLNRYGKLTRVTTFPWADILTRAGWGNRDIHTDQMRRTGNGSSLSLVPYTSQEVYSTVGYALLGYESALSNWISMGSTWAGFQAGRP